MNEAEQQTGEAVSYEAQLHWIVFAPPLAFLIGGLVAIVFNPLAAIAFLCVSVLGIVAAYVRLATTRIFVTDRRVIYKTGLVARRTVEMNRDKVESIDVSESILGRLLDFGSVKVKGTGGGIEAINNVASPFALRDWVAAHKAERAPLPGIGSLRSH